MKKLSLALAIVTLLACVEGALAQGTQEPGYPTPKEGDWIAKDFRFHTGEVMPELRVHYTTVGEPSGEAVVILHGTAGSGGFMLNPGLVGGLLGPGTTTRCEQILHHPA